MEETEFDLICDVIVGLYTYEIDLNKNNFFKDNNGKLLYILNPNFLGILKNYLHYEDIKDKIKEYKLTDKQIKNDKNFKTLIKPNISRIKSKFYEQFKDSKDINCFDKEYKNKSLKLSFKYYLESNIIPQKYFRPIYNLLKLNKIQYQYQCNNVTFLDNKKIAIEINTNILEIFHMDQNLKITPNYLVVFNSKEDFFDKFLYYKSFETFLEKEKIQYSEKPKNNIFYLSKESQNNYGKIIDLGLFKFNKNNINNQLKTFDINQKLIIEKLEKENNDFKGKVEMLRNGLDKIATDLKSTQEENKKLKNELEIVKKENEIIKNEKENIDNKYIELKNKLNEKDKILNKKELEIKELNNKIKDNEIIINNIFSEKDIMSNKNKELKNKIKEMEKIENINKQLNKLLKEKENMINNIKNLLTQKDSEIMQLKKKLKETDNNIQNLTNEKDIYINENNALKNKLKEKEKIENINKQLNNQLKEKENMINNIKNLLTQKDSEIMQLKNKLKETDNNTQILANEKNIYINENNALKNKLKEMEKYIKNEEIKIQDKLNNMKQNNENEIKNYIQNNEIYQKYKKYKKDNQVILEKNIQLENNNKKLQKNIEELNNKLKQQIQINNNNQKIKNQNQNNMNPIMNQNQNNMNQNLNNMNQNNMSPMMNQNQNNINPIMNQNNMNQIMNQNPNIMNQIMNQNNMNPIMNQNNQNQNMIQNQNINFNAMNQNPNFNFMNNPIQNFMNPNQINHNIINNNQINQIQMIVPKPPIKNSTKIRFKLEENYPMTPKKGLVNIGSTCYMNATLECFSQTKSLTEYFLDSDHKDLIIKGLYNDPSKLRLAKEYYYVVSNLWNINSNQYYEPKSFKKVLGTLNPLFKKMEASDAKDMIVFFLEQIHKEINRVKPPDVNAVNFTINQYNREEMLNHFIKDFKVNNKSIISDNFFVVTETTQKCQNCKNNNTPNYICYNYNIQNCFIFPLEEVRKYRDQRLMNIQMNQMNQMMMGMMGMGMMGMNMNMPQINTSGNVVSIYDCFEFNQKEDLMFGENRIYCNLCRQNAESLYGNKILTLPNILIMILNRGKDNMYKIDLPFDEQINLTKYVLNANEQYIYSIYGVITHLGPSGQSGHFIASCKSPIDGLWYKYNDAIVSVIKNFMEEVVQMPTPYILFYQRVKQ